MVEAEGGEDGGVGQSGCKAARAGQVVADVGGNPWHRFEHDVGVTEVDSVGIERRQPIAFLTIKVELSEHGG